MSETEFTIFVLLYFFAVGRLLFVILDIFRQVDAWLAERRSQKHLDEMIAQIDWELPREFRLRG